MILMNSNAELAEYLKATNYIRSERVEKAFLSVDRKKFVSPELARFAYYDTPLPTLEGQTISAPGVVAAMTEALEVKEGEKVLEVGTGSGYQTAILAKLVGGKGKIFSVERIRKLAEEAKKLFERTGLKNVEVVVGDGSKGLAGHEPFDKIIVTAAAAEIPKKLVEQLKTNGIIVLPVEEGLAQQLVVGRKKKSGDLEIKQIFPVLFVPLVEEK